MMYLDAPLPFMEFQHLEHADEKVYVNAALIVAIARGASGVNLHLMGGGVVTVRGKASDIRKAVDQFIFEWPERRHEIMSKMEKPL